MWRQCTVARAPKASWVATFACAITLGCLLVTVSVLAAGPALQQSLPQFRTATILVPVDVRVVDRRGRPITDLTEADFTILEDGVPQMLSHFHRQSLVAMGPEAVSSPGLRRTTRSLDQASSARRVFLLLLGRGRLQVPAKGIDALQHFVRDLLLPQDLVAVFAWNRATPFTSDHARIAALLERFGAEHERIEGLMRQRFSGLGAVYGSARIPAPIQEEIDSVFDGFPARRIVTTPVANSERIAADERRVRELLEGTSQLDGMGADEAGLLNVSFDEFVDAAIETNQNLANLYTSIEYLRYIAGEKHLVFVTENLLSLQRQEDGDSLASFAADARVAIHPIHTGGLPRFLAGSISRGIMQHSGGAVGAIPLAARDQRVIADRTGGRASLFRWARDAVERIAAITRFTYVLGYYPTNEEWNGKQRRVEVRVNRSGATVMYRHSYAATRDLRPLDLREFAGYRRIMSAGNFDGDVSDIGLDVIASYREDEGIRTVTIQVRIAADRLTLVQDANDLRVGQVKIAAFAGDSRENVVGQSWQDMDLRLRPTTYQQFLADGIPYSVTFPVAREPSHVKLIVYDQAADLLGSRTVRITN